MKKVAVISGKGGTGKTTVVASLAAIIKDKVVADCDVDAANLYLLLHPEMDEMQEFWSGKKAIIDTDKCMQCNLCQDTCRFDAITDYQVDPLSCEGCGLCHRICPAEAITMHDNLSGQLFTANSNYGPMVFARLGVAQGNSGKLVAAVKAQADLVAVKRELDCILSDGPPGIGCPVIATISEANLVLIVTEPTLSAIHDLERICCLCSHFDIDMAVCINKCDLNDENHKQIEAFCQQRAVPIVANIPFDNKFLEAIIHGRPAVEYCQNGIRQKMEKLWTNILALLIKQGR